MYFHMYPIDGIYSVVKILYRPKAIYCICVSVGDPLQLALTFGAIEMQDKDCQLFYLIYIRIAKKHVLLNLIRVTSAFWCLNLEITALGILKKVGKK